MTKGEREKGGGGFGYAAVLTGCRWIDAHESSDGGAREKRVWGRKRASGGAELPRRGT